jgi:hypothetical protein
MSAMTSNKAVEAILTVGDPFVDGHHFTFRSSLICRYHAATLGKFLTLHGAASVKFPALNAQLLNPSASEHHCAFCAATPQGAGAKEHGHHGSEDTVKPDLDAAGD